MCADYEPPVQLELAFDVPQASFEYPREAFPGYFAPILAPAAPGGPVEPLRAMFGMIPHWADSIKYARNGYNSRSETIDQKPTFKKAWSRQQRCLIPAQCFFEPNYESGKPIRWRIQRKDGQPFAIAGIYETCDPKADQVDFPSPKLRSFSMITINAEAHPLMRRFHGPEDEKRSVVILPRNRYDDWLQAPSPAEARALLLPFDPEDYEGVPAPLPPRSPRKKGGVDSASL